MQNKLRLDFIIFYVLIGCVAYMLMAGAKNLFVNGVFS